MTEVRDASLKLQEDERKKVFQEFKQTSHADGHNLEESQRYRASLNSKQVTGIFDEWVGGDGSYDKDMKTIGYRGPELTAELLSRLIPSNRDQYKIIDAGAGSGLSGKELKTKGFTQIDWLDPSGMSVEAAKKTGAYTRFIVDYLSEKPLDVLQDTYDIMVCVGAFFEGLIPLSAFTEMIRVVKPGGLIIISISESSLETCKEYKGKLEPKIQELIDDKQWELVERTRVEKYVEDVPAIFFVLKVLRSG